MVLSFCGTTFQQNYDFVELYAVPILVQPLHPIQHLNKTPKFCIAIIIIYGIFKLQKCGSSVILFTFINKNIYIRL